MQELDFDYRLFLDRSTLLFGETGTGKSTIMIDILYQLQPYVDQIVVISPMDRQNHTYDKGIVPLPCIHYTITAKLLDDIWERQNALSAVYTKANKSETLQSLFNKIPGNQRARAIIDSVYQKLQSYKDELAGPSAEPAIEASASRAKVAEMEADCKKLIDMIWHNSINCNRGYLQRVAHSKDEQFALKYLNLNPRLVLVLDDCTDLLAKFKRHPVMQKLFYQGRWAYITTIIACHTDKALDPELKKNVFVSIFTEETCAHAYFERKSNDLDKEAKARALAACKMAFTPLARHQKLAWVRDEKKFYRLTATTRPNFRFGSQYIWEYCDRIKADIESATVDNKFIWDFK
jgi:hypothetical protein